MSSEGGFLVIDDPERARQFASAFKERYAAVRGAWIAYNRGAAEDKDALLRAAHNAATELAAESLMRPNERVYDRFDADGVGAANVDRLTSDIKATRFEARQVIDLIQAEWRRKHSMLDSGVVTAPASKKQSAPARKSNAEVAHKRAQKFMDAKRASGVKSESYEVPIIKRMADPAFYRMLIDGPSSNMDMLINDLESNFKALAVLENHLRNAKRRQTVSGADNLDVVRSLETTIRDVNREIEKMKSFLVSEFGDSAANEDLSKPVSMQKLRAILRKHGARTQRRYKKFLDNIARYVLPLRDTPDAFNSMLLKYRVQSRLGLTDEGVAKAVEEAEKVKVVPGQTHDEKRASMKSDIDNMAHVMKLIKEYEHNLNKAMGPTAALAKRTLANMVQLRTRLHEEDRMLPENQTNARQKYINTRVAKLDRVIALLRRRISKTASRAVESVPAPADYVLRAKLKKAQLAKKLGKAQERYYTVFEKDALRRITNGPGDGNAKMRLDNLKRMQSDPATKMPMVKYRYEVAKLNSKIAKGRVKALRALRGSIKSDAGTNILKSASDAAKALEVARDKYTKAKPAMQKKRDAERLKKIKQLAKKVTDAIKAKKGAAAAEGRTRLKAVKDFKEPKRTRERKAQRMADAIADAEGRMAKVERAAKKHGMRVAHNISEYEIKKSSKKQAAVVASSSSAGKKRPREASAAGAKATTPQKRYQELVKAHAANPQHEMTTDFFGHGPKYPFRFLSNMWMCAGEHITYMGRKFDTVEHAYQFAKFMANSEVGADLVKAEHAAANAAHADQLVSGGSVKSAEDAKKHGGKGASKKAGAVLVKGWDQAKLRIMDVLLEQKFGKCKEFRDMLKMSGRGLIREVNGRDKEWGCKASWVVGCDAKEHGRNLLGIALMDLRGRKFASLRRDDSAYMHQ